MENRGSERQSAFLVNGPTLFNHLHYKNNMDSVLNNPVVPTIE